MDGPRELRTDAVAQKLRHLVGRTHERQGQGLRPVSGCTGSRCSSGAPSRAKRERPTESARRLGLPEKAARGINGIRLYGAVRKPVKPDAIGGELGPPLGSTVENERYIRLNCAGSRFAPSGRPGDSESSCRRLFTETSGELKCSRLPYIGARLSSCPTQVGRGVMSTAGKVLIVLVMLMSPRLGHPGRRRRSTQYQCQHQASRSAERSRKAPDEEVAKTQAEIASLTDRRPRFKSRSIASSPCFAPASRTSRQARSQILETLFERAVRARDRPGNSQKGTDRFRTTATPRSKVKTKALAMGEIGRQRTDRGH